MVISSTWGSIGLEVIQSINAAGGIFTSASSAAVSVYVVEYLRHPMYGGLLMASLGLAAVAHDEARLLAAAVLWLVLEQKVRGVSGELNIGASLREYLVRLGCCDA